MALVGLTRQCGLSSGGVKKLWLAEVASVTSFTFSTPAYSAITMGSGLLFKVYEFEPDSAELKETVSYENNCMKVVHSIEFFLARMSATTRVAVEEIALAASCGLIGVAEDNNGVKWVLGYSQNHLKLRPLSLKTGNGTTGKKLTDANGYTLTIENENNELMRVYTGTDPVTS